MHSAEAKNKEGLGMFDIVWLRKFKSLKNPGRDSNPGYPALVKHAL